MSEVKVNKISPRTNCGTVQLGDSGDTITIPAGATITNNGTQTGFGRTGTVDWQTSSIKTATFTAANGEGYFCNTTSGGFTVNLPAGSAGAIVSLQDYNNTFDSNSLLVTPNGSEKINGGAGSVTLSTEGEGVTLVYIDSTVGWRSIQDSAFSDVGSNYVSATGGTITTSGNCKIHTFTGPGTFCVTSAGSGSNSVVSYMVVAGGGGGGVKRAGGGGAGGFREYKSPVTPYTASPLDGNPGGTEITVTAQGYPITVGGGGSSGTGSTPICTTANPVNTQGSTSTFSTVSSAGGGAGGGTGTPTGAGGSGGSGGGGVHAMTGRPSPASNAGGAGNTPPVSPAQGFAGGNACQPEPAGQAGGGGGATTVGADGGDGQTAPKGAGGTGATTSISGSPTTYAGGGGGGGRPNGRQGSGGSGGGGPGANNAPKPNGDPASSGSAGTANTGGGGGGSADVDGAVSGAGGSGIVIIRYKFQT
jgi:hypothetical protein